MNRCHFDDHARPELEFLCIDGEMASVIMNARSEGLKIRGVSLLSELTGKVESVKGTAKLCRCGNTPSPVDNFCRNCRPPSVIPRRRV